MSINIVEHCLKKYKEEKEELEILLSRELTNKESESFEEANSAQVWKIKDIENLVLKDQFLDWAFLELNCKIINSETNKVIFNNRKMIFSANVRENIDDGDRFCFLGFGDRFVLR